MTVDNSQILRCTHCGRPLLTVHNHGAGGPTLAPSRYAVVTSVERYNTGYCTEEDSADAQARLSVQLRCVDCGKLTTHLVIVNN